jgi:hypothetical protein
MSLIIVPVGERPCIARSHAPAPGAGLRLSAAIAAVLATFLALVAPAAAQTIDLRPKFTVGRDFRLTLVTEETTTLSGELLPEASKSSRRGEFQMLLKPVVTEGDTSLVDLTFERVKYSLVDGETKATFDSTQAPKTDEDKTLAEALKPFVNATLKVRFDKDGNITGMEGGDQILGGGAMGSVGQQLGSVGGLNNLLGPVINVKNTKGQVKVGEKWTAESRLGDMGIGQFKVKTDYHAKGMRNGLAEIAFDGKIDSDSESMSTAMKLKNSTYKGTYLWDTEMGMLKSMEMDQVLTIEQSLDANNKGKPDMSVQRTAKTRVTRQDARK